MSNVAVKLNNLDKDEQAEAIELQQRLDNLKKKNRSLKVTKVTFAVAPTKAGPVGMTINGMGMPKFFYKQHLELVIGNSQESEDFRAALRQWVIEHPELTDKE